VNAATAEAGQPVLLFEREAGIARLTLNRPEAGNAINVGLAKALLEAAITCDQDETIRCVLLTGAGRFFCVGGDVASFATAGDQTPALLQEMTGYLHPAILRLMQMNKPLVVAVIGAVAGAGCSLALIGDIVLAAPSVHFTAAYTAIGLSPDGGTTWLLPRLLGMRRTQEIILTNRRVKADEAVQLGLVTRLTGESELMDEAAAVAANLAASAIRAIGRSRNLLLSSFDIGLEDQLNREADSIAAAGGDAESREGIAAFLAKRKPNFVI
jgi:2-(1,2-epoxy-1,2-dihydrophenyl)acetyl-CoA isomerase